MNPENNNEYFLQYNCEGPEMTTKNKKPKRREAFQKDGSVRAPESADPNMPCSIETLTLPIDNHETKFQGGKELCACIPHLGARFTKRCFSQY